MKKNDLKNLSATTFYDNDQGGIQPEGHRNFNNTLIDSMALNEDLEKKLDESLDAVRPMKVYAVNSSNTPGLAERHDIMTLIGYDYSLLTEQVVHGEFWCDHTGTRKQVYVQTFIGTLATTQGYPTDLLIAPQVMPIFSACNSIVGNGTDSYNLGYKWDGFKKHSGEYCVFSLDKQTLGQVFVITLKYIK